MDVPIFYIGVAQSLFAALIIFMKRPLKIADKIMGIWLVGIASIFVINIILKLYAIEEGEWVLSSSISITFPPFLYLYSKYVTVEHSFKRLDFLHASPAVVVGVLIFLFRNPVNTDFVSGVNYYEKIIWLRDFIGRIFILMLWIYGALSVININRYKKQLSNIYSYESDRISLSWLHVVVISFVVIYNVIIILGALHEAEVINYDTEFVRKVVLLVFVYVVKYMGLPTESTDIRC